VLRYTLKRLALALPLALGVATLTFVLLETAPGQPADLLLGSGPVPPEVRERLDRAYGFDRPAVERYARWLGALALRGELGWSHSRHRPVRELIAAALPPLAAGVALGVAAAARRGRWPDRLIGVGGLLLYAMPTFWLGLMAILLFTFVVPVFPAASMRSVGAVDWSWPRRLADLAWHLALPAAVLGLASAAAMTRFVRAGLLEALGEEFVRAARARGLDDRRVMLGHALRNAAIPLINLVGLSLPILFSGSLVVEVVFAWPGMGRLTYDAIRAHDVSVVLAATLLAALMVVAGNLAADLAMAAVDPRIRVGGSGTRR